MSILVTGGTGLVGSHLIKKLVSEGKSVRAIYRSSIPNFDFSDRVQWVQADILDVVSLEQAMEGVSQVYHCAAFVSFNPRRKDELNSTNIEGTHNVVNACLEATVQKLLFVSSVAALGRIRQDVLINESMQWSEETSNSEYGRTKFLSEMEVWRGVAEGLNAVIVNPTIILGGGDWNKGSTELFKSAYNEFPWYTEGISGFVDVDDVVEAMVLLMESNVSAERFILSGENLPFRQVFTMAANCFNKKPPHKKVTPFLASIVWRVEALKSKFAAKDPMLTKETARTAQTKVQFDNSKFLKAFPNFRYTPVSETITRICGELRLRHRL